MFKYLSLSQIWREIRYPVLLLSSLTIASSVLPSLTISDPVKNAVAHVLHLLLVLSVSWTLWKLLRLARNVVHQAYDTSQADNLRQRALRTQIDFLYRLVVVLLVIITISIALMTFENARRLGTSLIASAGIASLVIGFAAQRSLSNLIAGFQIAFTQPMRIDDVVIVEHEWGRIEEITLTYVVVRLWDLRRMIVPITYFVEKPFENWTRTSSALLAYAMFYVDFSLPVDEFRKGLTEIVQQSALWDRKTCALQVTNIRDNCMELRALVSAANASDAFDFQCLIREKMIHFIQSRYPDRFPIKREKFLGAS